MEALLVPSSDPTAPVIHSDVKCNLSQEDIVGPRYYGKPPTTRGNKTLNFSEDSFFKVKECDIDPIIFIRFAQPLVDSQMQLPSISADDFYPKLDNVHGIDLEIRPDYRTVISKALIEFDLAKYEERKKNFAPFANPEMMKLLKDYINTMVL